MTEGNAPVSSPRKPLSARRVVLLASAACLGAAALAGPTYHELNFGHWAPPAQAAESAQNQPGFADLVAKVKPAVISVRVKLDQTSSTTGMGEDENAVPGESGSPLEKFFRQFGAPGGPNGMPQQRHMITGEGSGFFISPDGYAVTNYHVVDHATSVQVTTDDGKIYTAKVVGSDQKSDLALIKVDGRNDFPSVQFASHTPRIGDWVVAVGNPFGLGGTVTAGIVSARGRDIGAGPYDDFIQIDAPINKGNSGGPAFDLDGNVIGVNTAIYSPSGGSVGIGFDIPADTAKSVIAQLKDKGAVTRGWMGTRVQPVTADIAESLGLKNASGALVDELEPGSPAAKAGIKSGDVITAVDGAPVKDSRELAKGVSAKAPGTSVKLTVMRDGQEKAITLTLGELPNQREARGRSESEKVPTGGAPHLGLTVAPAGMVAGAGGSGVAITAVDPESAAAEHGLQAGDVILDVGGKSVSTPADMRKELAALHSQGKRTVLMRVKSGDSTKFVALPLAQG